MTEAATGQKPPVSMWLETNASRIIYASFADKPELVNVQVKKGEVVVLMYEEPSTQTEKFKFNIKENDSAYVSARLLKVWNAVKDPSNIEFSVL